MDKDGENLEKVLDVGEVLSFCDASNKLAFTVDNGQRICVYSFEEEKIDTIIDFKEFGIPGFDWSIHGDWDTEGNRIAFTENPSSFPESGEDTLALWVYDVDSDSLILRRFMEGQLPNDYAYHLRWQPYGRWIVFEDIYNIWRIRDDGEELMKILPKEGR